MDGKHILVNDVGTTGTRAVLFDRETNVISEVYREIALSQLSQEELSS